MKAALIRVPTKVAIKAQVIILSVKSNLIFLFEAPILLIVSNSEECCFMKRVIADAAVPLAKINTAIDRTISVSLLIP